MIVLQREIIFLIYIFGLNFFSQNLFKIILRQNAIFCFIQEGLYIYIINNPSRSPIYIKNRQQKILSDVQK
ncbi:hypothetical protein pb186bvf_013273 [Paramecium bursaria]